MARAERARGRVGRVQSTPLVGSSKTYTVLSHASAGVGTVGFGFTTGPVEFDPIDGGAAGGGRVFYRYDGAAVGSVGVEGWGGVVCGRVVLSVSVRSH